MAAEFIVFIILILIVAACLWFLLARVFEGFGNFILNKILKPFRAEENNKKEDIEECQKDSK
jgi:predicted membrane protein